MSPDLDAYFMPFTAQRAFKKKPRLLQRAEGMYYYAEDGRRLLDSCAGLWCVNAGHSHPLIVEAIRKQAAVLDYAPSFGYSHPLAFETADALCKAMPAGIDHVFFSNSGSEAVDTAIKVAVAYQRARGKPGKAKVIGRERGYHGVNIGGTSVGGIPPNRSAFTATMMANVDHLPHTHNLEQQAFSQGLPAWGAHLADALENIMALHGADNIAAVIVEPVAGSTGVLLPPKGYLEKLRAICTKHDILLVFDEVITAFGRLGHYSAADYFGVQPDMIVAAKGINSGAVPMGATFVRGFIYDAFMQGGEYGVEFAHGYTYSAHPLACAAALAAQAAYQQDGMFENVRALEKDFADAVHSLKGAAHVIDTRAIGLMAGIELDPGARKPPAERSRAMEAAERLFWEHDMLVRFTGNTIALSPPLIVNAGQVGEMVDRIRTALGKLD
jgi:beta-alanine--pyruvate transaminase